MYVFPHMYEPSEVKVNSAFVHAQTVKTSAKGFYGHIEKSLVGQNECFRSIPKENQVVLKYNLHFSGQKKNPD